MTLSSKRGKKPDWFVLDASAINDIETTGALAIEHVLDLLKRRNITFALSHATAFSAETTRQVT